MCAGRFAYSSNAVFSALHWPRCSSPSRIHLGSRPLGMVTKQIFGGAPRIASIDAVEVCRRLLVRCFVALLSPALLGCCCSAPLPLAVVIRTSTFCAFVRSRYSHGNDPNPSSLVHRERTRSERSKARSQRGKKPPQWGRC